MIGNIDVDIRLMYYLQLCRHELDKDIDAMFRYKALGNLCRLNDILPTPRNLITVLLEKILND